MRILRSSFLLLALPFFALSAQTNDAARTLLGISFGLLPGRTLWEVTNQTITPISTPPSKAGVVQPPYGPDVWDLKRGLVHNRPTFSVHGTRFFNRRIGYTAEVDYYAFQTMDACTVVKHGTDELHPGDPELKQICDSVPVVAQGSHSSFAMQTGLIVRPFAAASFQPFVEGLVGVASTPSSMVTLTSVYQGSVFPIYGESATSNIAPTYTLGGGFVMDAVNGMVFRVEARSTAIKQTIVSGPSTNQGATTPVQSGFQSYFSLLVGVDLVLSKDRGKRY